MSASVFKAATLTFVVFFVTLAGSCARSDHSTEGPHSPRDLRIDQLALQAVLPGMSDFQSELLQDGVLTFSEYEAAVFAAVKCERDAGLQIFAYPVPGTAQRPGPELTARGEYQYLPVPPEGSDGAALHRAFDECEARYAGALRPLWADHVAPTEKDMQSARDMIAKCLREHGVKAPNQPSGNELMQLAFPPNGVPSHPRPNEPYLGCANSAAESYGIPGYLGQ